MPSKSKQEIPLPLTDPYLSVKQPLAINYDSKTHLLDFY